MSPYPKIAFDIDRYFPDSTYDVGDSGRASFEEKRPLYLSASKHFLNHYRNEIKERHRSGADGSWVVARYTEMTDILIRKLYRSLSKDLARSLRDVDQIALVALGGYGRSELNPHSDIDIMFLYSGKESSRVEDIAQKILYFLWDMKLDVGYSVRTVADCIEMANADSTVKTALLDARFLIGNRVLYKEFQKTLISQIMTKASDAFIRNKIAEQKTRRDKYGASVYLLEPNLKEGEGGLRDLHTALWVAKVKYKVIHLRELIQKGILSEEELDLYQKSLEYLWRLRNEMHFFAGRKNDQLTFEAQINLAKFLGYEDRGKVLAVEEFMRDFYIHAVKVEHFSSMLISRCSVRDESALKILGYFIRRPIGEGFYVLKGELIIPNEGIFQEDPARLMKVFEYAQKQGVTLSVKVKGLIRENLKLVNDKFRRHRDVNKSFFNILAAPKLVAETLNTMHHLGFLHHFIPEFERIYCKVQHDLYHIYTIDTHSLFAVEEITKLWRGDHQDDLPLLTQLAREVEKKELLLLAVLLHDIGKGEGGGHAEKGAEMAPTICRRIGLSREDSDRLEFLVRHHILMAHIAQRRDLHDEKMIIQFARQMGKSENLKMLYLLTYADIKAVGPDVWTEWKALLLQELYEKAFSILERGDFKLEARSERVKNAKRKVVEILEHDLSPLMVKEELRALTTRHLLSNPPAVIAGHVRILAALETEPLVTRIDHEMEKGYTNFTICTFDTPGLFSMITGVMAANGMNILGAQIHTSKNGKALDILQANSPQGFAITDENRWKRVEDDLRSILEGKIQVRALVEKRRRPTLLVEKLRPRFPDQVEIDNEVSEEYTVIDIYTHDNIGLLYRITSTLTDLGLYIDVAKISTKVDQVADVFYVKDIFGQKIMSSEKLAEIRSRLIAAVAEEGV